jgi:hypothetical protein
LQGPTQGLGNKKSAPKASPQPQTDYQKPDKSSATNAQSPSFSKDAHLATGIEASNPTKEELETSKHSFRDDDLIYELSDIGLLSVRIDVKKGVYENSGPVLWRDVIRVDELDVSSPESFLGASLRGSHLAMKDHLDEISYASKSPSNVDDEQSCALQEVSESGTR